MSSSNLLDSPATSKCVFHDTKITSAPGQSFLNIHKKFLLIAKIPILQTNLYTISQYMHQLKYMGSYELIKYRYYTLREKGWDAHKFFGFTDKKS